MVRDIAILFAVLSKRTRACDVRMGNVQCGSSVFQGSPFSDEWPNPNRNPNRNPNPSECDAILTRQFSSPGLSVQSSQPAPGTNNSNKY